MCPAAAWLVNRRRELLCHALVVEMDDGLVLVETGIGTADLARPSRLGPGRWLAGFSYDPATTALAGIERLGFTAGDVRHVVLTHMDLDHAGGLSDFPDAAVHVHADELAAARSPSAFHRLRYRSVHWAHGPRWRPARGEGERWFGFDAVRDLDGLPPEILMVPLPGHSPGHCAVAVNRGDRWLLHCGDAYFHAGEVGPRGRGSAGLSFFQWLVEDDRATRLHNQARLRELERDHGDEIEVFCAHDPDEFDRLAQ